MKNVPSNAKLIGFLGLIPMILGLLGDWIFQSTGFFDCYEARSNEKSQRMGT